MAQQLEPWVAEELGNVVLGAGEVVVNNDHLIAGSQEPFSQVGTDETCTTGNQNSHGHHAICRCVYPRAKEPRRALRPSSAQQPV